MNAPNVDGPNHGDIVQAILAVQRGLEDKTVLLARTLRRQNWMLALGGVLMAAVLVVAALALVQSRDNHKLAESTNRTAANTNQTLQIVKDAVDPNGQLAQRSQRATAAFVAGIVRCVDNHIDVVILHGTPDPACPR